MSTDEPKKPQTISGVMEVARADLDRAIATLERSPTASVAAIESIDEWATATIATSADDSYTVLLHTCTSKGAGGVVKGGMRWLTYVGITGKVLVCVEGATRELRPGKPVLVRSYTNHRIEADSSAKVLVILTTPTAKDETEDQD